MQGFCDSLRTELLHDNSRIRLTMVLLPALNTLQFDSLKRRLPGRAQPVPPIFQPEVAAKAIVWASQQDRREVFVGMPTVVAVVGNKIAQARPKRWRLWATQHRATLGATAIAAGLVGIAAVVSRAASHAEE